MAGVWKDLTDSVNSMAGNLTGQVRNIAEVTTAVANGDLRKKVTVDVKGEILQLKNTINAMVDQLNCFATRGHPRGPRGRHRGAAGRPGPGPGRGGVWKDLTDSVNCMAGNLTGQVRNIAEVTTAVANGDLTKKVTVDVRGEILELKNTINAMVDQLNSFASEVTRVAREVGTEGGWAARRSVRGVAGVWKDLTDNVNSHGRQPHRPGAEHRRGHHRRRQRRPLQEDHRRREGRDPPAQEHDQRDGRPAQQLRLAR